MMGRTGHPRDRWIGWLIAATILLATYAFVVAWTGGFSVRIAGVRLRSHSWVRPALLALAALALLVRSARVQLAAILADAWAAAERPRVTRALVLAAMAWTLALGVQFGTFASGGADSYGYVGQARLLAHGRLTDRVSLNPAFTWPDLDATLTPLAFRRGQSRGVIAPVYPPGLPLLLAPLTLISERAIYLLVPVLGALTVWIVYRLGIELGDRLAGAIAALLLSVSPTFLYQVVQPMSDVPATACWLFALLLASRGSVAAAAAAGALSSLAILIRPNLAPAAALILVAAACDGTGTRARRALVFAAAMVPALVALGWIQNVRFGSPLASGYGTLREGFSPANIGPNLARYPRWLTASHTWFIWLSVLAPLWIVRRAARPWLAWTAAAFVAAIWVAYLPYTYFQPREWFYTRFLLPAIPLMLFFAVAVALWCVRRLPVLLRVPAATALTLAMLLMFVQGARARGAFEIRLQERKYPMAGAFVREQLPRGAMILAGQHSGSIRYYANRPTLRWDLIPANRLDGVLADVRAAGFEPFAVLDRGEDDDFRRRFETTGQRAVQRLLPLAVLGDARVYAFGE